MLLLRHIVPVSVHAKVCPLKNALSLQRKPVRVSTAVAVSLIAHALLLSMAIGGAGFGLPSLTLPWKERRVGADDLRITLAPTQPLMPAPEMAPVITSEPLPVQAAPPPVPEMTMPAPPAVPTPTPAPAAATVTASVVAPVQKTIDKETELAALAHRQEAIRAEQAASADQARIQLERAESARREAARLEAAHRASLREEALANERASQEAEREATARVEQARQAQQEAARRDTANLEAARQEQIRQEQAKLELVKQEQVQREQARQELAKQEQSRREQARQEQARQAEVQQAAQQAAQQEAARQEQARLEPARQEQARLAQVQRERAEQEAQREERLRAIGQQMKQEAAQRTPLPGASGTRRGWLFGRADANAELVQYAETMARKIELNQTMDIVREALKQAHVSPIVTVAIRADGSVEKVTFVVSSGALALDDAIRKVIASQARYAAFTPALARQYDVIEIRRTWNFDTAIRLQ